MFGLRKSNIYIIHRHMLLGIYSLLLFCVSHNIHTVHTYDRTALELFVFDSILILIQTVCVLDVLCNSDSFNNIYCSCYNFQ